MVRSCLLVCSILIMGLVSSAVFAQDSSPSGLTVPGTRNTDLDILFTGRLLGYFRNPGVQSGVTVDKNSPCPGVTGPKDISSEGQKLLDAAQSYAYERRVFVGTGDNFALFLPSRVLEPRPEQSQEWKKAKVDQYGKDQFDWDWEQLKWVKPTRDSIALGLRNGLVMIPTDNVGCFLSYAGYDAIVPGKEDFYFGADRVRALARFLASISQSAGPQYHPVQMLAANLLVKTSWVSGHDPIPDSKKPPLPFKISDVSSSPNPYMTFPSDGTEILPWLAEIKGVFKREINEAEVVISASGDDPDRRDWNSSIDSAGVHIKFPYTGECWSVRDIASYDVDPKCHQLEPVKGEADPRDEQKNVHRLRWRLPLKRLAGGNYKVCVWIPDRTKNPVDYSVPPTCSRFSVGIPFLQYIDPLHLSDDVKDAFHKQDQNLIPSPYLVKPVCSRFADGTCKGEWNTVAVFGAVDPDMEQEIGRLDSDWRAIKKDTKKNVNCQRDLKCGKNEKKYETALEIADPAKSLKQLIDYLLACGKYGNSTHGDDCYGAESNGGPELEFKSKILLAQMDGGKASLLAAHLKRRYHFETVISEFDQQQFTRNQVSVVDETLSPRMPLPEQSACDKDVCDLPSFIAVPPPAWDLAWQDDPVRVLRVSQIAMGQQRYVVSGTGIEQIRSGTAICDGCVQSAAAQALAQSRTRLAEDPQLSGAARHELVEFLGKVLPVQPAVQNPLDPTKEETESVLKDATLYAMLKETRADVALLQKRDFYLPIPVADCLLRQLSGFLASTMPCEIQRSAGLDSHAWQKILDALIWKGDILTVIPVRGSVLQAVMKDSRQFDAKDESGLSLINETGRGLYPLGIKAAGYKDTYLINDLPLDPNRLYSVATTDYIALGDTGYPELIDPSVPGFPRPLWDKRRLEYISGLVCNELRNALGNHKLPTEQNIECTSTFSGKDYFDELYVQLPPSAGNTWQEAWKEWFLFGPRLGQDDPKQKPGLKVKTDVNGNPDPNGKDSRYPSLESWAQEQPPAWRFSLDKTSIGFAIQRHSDTQANLNRNFGGVSNSQATAPRSHSWNIDQEASYTYNHHAWDFVSTEAVLYNASFADARSGAYRNPNQSTDSFVFSVGPRFHLPEKRKLPHWGIETYLHFDTQPVALEQSLSLTQNQVDVATPLQFFLPRVYTLTDRLGIGRYDQKSYFEVGLEGGRAFGAFDQFDIYTNGVLVLPCVPSATLSLQKCVSKLGDTIVTPTSKVTTLQSSRARTGLYWHSFLSFPVVKRMSASLENQGEFYFNNAGDNSTDTRLQHLVTAKYSFQVWPSLSFSPTYQLFLYENKQAYMTLWQQQAMLTINFNFNWTSRRIAASQLQYQPNPSASQ